MVSTNDLQNRVIIDVDRAPNRLLSVILPKDQVDTVVGSAPLMAQVEILNWPFDPQPNEVTPTFLLLKRSRLLQHLIYFDWCRMAGLTLPNRNVLGLGRCVCHTMGSDFVGATDNGSTNAVVKRLELSHSVIVKTLDDRRARLRIAFRRWGILRILSPHSNSDGDKQRRA